MLRERKDSYGNVTYYVIDRLEDIPHFIRAILDVVVRAGYKSDMDVKCVDAGRNYADNSYYIYVDFSWEGHAASFCLELSRTFHSNKSLPGDIKSLLRSLTQFVESEYHSMKDIVIFRKEYERDYVF
tara:strand:+ start:259 stop:639 length:381 start_codon:yes stop_codon:yes gene_type:complete